MRRIVLLAFGLFPVVPLAQAPQLISLDQANQLLVTPAVPLLSPLASVAHMYGAVKVQIVIDTQGRPTQLTVLSGWVGHHGSAMSSIRRSAYRPFVVDGKPVPVTTVVTLTYTAKTPPSPPRKVPVDHVAERQFQENAAACNNALRDVSKPEKQIKPCAEAAKVAKSLDVDEYSSWQNEADLEASTAFKNNKQFEQALAYTSQTFARVDLGYGSAFTPGECYLSRAEAEIGLKDYVSASSDLSKAEMSDRSAASWIQDDKLKQVFKQKLKEVLVFHARLFTATGNQAGAKADLDEAATL